MDRISARSTFDMATRMRLVESDLDDIETHLIGVEARVDANHEEHSKALAAAIADSAVEMTRFRVAVYGLTTAVMVALITIIGTLIATR